MAAHAAVGPPEGQAPPEAHGGAAAAGPGDEQAAIDAAVRREEQDNVGVLTKDKLQFNIKQMASVAFPVKAVRDSWMSKRSLLDQISDLMAMGALDLAGLITLTSTAPEAPERRETVQKGIAELMKPHQQVWPAAAERIRREKGKVEFQDLSVAFNEAKCAIVTPETRIVIADCKSGAEAAEPEDAAAPGGAAAASAAGAAD